MTYGDDELSFEEVFVSGIYGNRAIPEGAAAAEAVLAVRPPIPRLIFVKLRMIED